MSKVLVKRKVWLGESYAEVGATVDVATNVAQRLVEKGTAEIVSEASPSTEAPKGPAQAQKPVATKAAVKK